MNDVLDALVIGAGFSGLGTGAALRARGVDRFAIVEQGAQAGHFWTGVYDRLHLHSAFHDMPHDGGLRVRYPTFLARDQLLDYFARYAALHGLAPHFRFGTRVARVRRIAQPGAGGAEWEVDTDGGPLRARCVAVATALNRVPKQPDVPGRDVFPGRTLHSAAYRNAAPFAGRSVLVVGSGNSAAEIALDLCENGARDVALWVRGPRHFLPLRRVAWFFRLFRLLGQFRQEKLWETHAITYGTPAFERVVDQRDKLGRFLSVDLSAYGIRRPEDGPFRETFAKARIPTFDVGAIAKIRSGAIRVIDGNLRPLEALEPRGVRLGGHVEPFDDVVFATGYEPRLEDLIADRALLGPVRAFPLLPLTDGRSRSRIHPTIFFPGFDVTPLGGVGLGRSGWEVGERIAETLARGQANAPASS